MAITFSAAARNAAVAGMGALLNGGTIRLLTSGEQTVADLAMSATAFAAPVDGTAQANAIASGTAAAGTVTRYEARSSGGAVIWSGDVVQGAAAPANALALVRTDFIGGEKIEPQSLTITAAGA